MKKVTIELDEREVSRVLNCVFTAYTNLEQDKGDWFQKEAKYLRELYGKIDNQFKECLTNKEGGEE